MFIVLMCITIYMFHYIIVFWLCLAGVIRAAAAAVRVSFGAVLVGVTIAGCQLELLWLLGSLRLWNAECAPLCPHRSHFTAAPGDGRLATTRGRVGAQGNCFASANYGESVKLISVGNVFFIDSNCKCQNSNNIGHFSWYAVILFEMVKNGLRCCISTLGLVTRRHLRCSILQMGSSRVNVIQNCLIIFCCCNFVLNYGPDYKRWYKFIFDISYYRYMILLIMFSTPTSDPDCLNCFFESIFVC